VVSISKDGYAIGNAIDFVHTMTDKHHRHLPASQLLDDSKKPFHFSLRQRGSGFIEDQDTRRSGQRPGDLDQLMFRTSEAV
jgi:hypothetical protein